MNNLVSLCMSRIVFKCKPPISANVHGTPQKFNIAPEKWWLEDNPSLLGFGNFSGAVPVKLRGGYPSTKGSRIFFSWLFNQPPPTVPQK